MECFGCGAMASVHPWVAIVKDGDDWLSVPVCMECHREPPHRRRLIKGHFFQESQSATALARAGSSDIQGG